MVMFAFFAACPKQSCKDWNTRSNSAWSRPRVLVRADLIQEAKFDGAGLFPRLETDRRVQMPKQT